METPHPIQPPSHEPLEGLCEQRATNLANESGTVFVEYLVIASLVTIGGAAAVMAVGVPLAQYYRFTIALLAVPFP